MTATNHALTGAAIGLTVSNPIAAVVLAFLSHFVLDALPHYGPSKQDIGGTSFRNYLLTDIGFCVVLVAVLLLSAGDRWLIASVCAFVATSPDAMWASDFVRARQGKKRQDIFKRGPVVRFHAFVQWYQKPLGAITEIVWAFAAILLLSRLTS